MAAGGSSVQPTEKLEANKRGRLRERREMRDSVHVLSSCILLLPRIHSSLGKWYVSNVFTNIFYQFFFFNAVVRVSFFL